jgi:hypothetical protein
LDRESLRWNLASVVKKATYPEVEGIAAIAIPAEAAPFASAVFIGEGIAIHIPGKIVCFQCIGELATGPAPVEGCLRKAGLLWEIAIARCNLHDSFGGINLRVVDIIAEIEQGIASEGYGVKLYDGALGIDDTLACVIVVARCLYLRALRSS